MVLSSKEKTATAAAKLAVEIMPAATRPLANSKMLLSATIPTRTVAHPANLPPMALSVDPAEATETLRNHVQALLLSALLTKLHRMDSLAPAVMVPRVTLATTWNAPRVNAHPATCNVKPSWGHTSAAATTPTPATPTPACYHAPALPLGRIRVMDYSRTCSTERRAVVVECVRTAFAKAAISAWRSRAGSTATKALSSASRVRSAVSCCYQY